jgi:iron complex outermembrane recepter protein
MYHNVKLNPTLNVSANGFMRLKGLQNFYELEPFGGLTLSLNQSVLQKKANLILTVNDVFRTNQTTFSLQQGNVSATGNRYGDTRRVGITFRYNFGIKPKEEKKPGFDQPSE